MREHADFLQVEKGVKIVPVFPAAVSLLSSFEQAYGPYPFPLYADPGKEAFQGFGHQRMNRLKLLAKTVLGVAAGRGKDFLPKNAEKKKVVTTSMKKSDIYMQGGSWLFDESKQLKWKHLDNTPENHASIEDIKQAVSTYIPS
ncbi:AhpC/TSA family protein [Salibacterium aidingense]|uniref:AhpC/TSA family protein n=1 Tax=Salibacterium aidingense TaxID=384933 RepID=UPI003BCA4CC2